jgi:predicted nucleic acid-binding protein
MSPEAIVLDSSAIVSLLHEDDSRHHEALAIAGRIGGRRVDIIMPAEVFAETMNVIGKKRGNSTAIAQGRYLLGETGYFLQTSRLEVMQAALTKLENQKNSVSFIDCLVMAWADHYQTKSIFGFDGAFAAAGYALPASSR